MSSSLGQNLIIASPVSSGNTPPVANAGATQSVVIGDIVSLDGSDSSDADGDPLTYKWSLASYPPDSNLGSFSATGVTASFTPDVPGDYVVQLIVNDGFEDSAPSTAAIHVAASQSWVTDCLRTLIANLPPPEAFKNKNLRNALIVKLNAIIKAVESGNYAEALTKLQEDVLAKTNGCTETGQPDYNDWLISCDEQLALYDEVQEIMEELTEVMNLP